MYLFYEILLFSKKFLPLQMKQFGMAVIFMHSIPPPYMIKQIASFGKDEGIWEI
jgi:hypothetical protein